MAQPDLTSGDHGVILNDGTKVPYNQLQETDPQLYSQYIQNLGQPGATLNQTNAAIPGVQANSQRAIVEATKAPATINLGSDLDKGVSLSTALKKYTPLGMTPDEIFTQYKAVNQRPDLSPDQLQNMGITESAIGKVGDNGSYADKWNTQQTVQGLRDLQDKFHKTGQFSHLVNKTGLANLGFDQSAANAEAAYESGRGIFTQHLNSVIPGGSNASGQIDSVSKSIPTSEDARNYAPGKADSMFSSAEDQLLKAKGYNYKSLGLDKPSSTPAKQDETPKKGGDLLNTLLNGANGDIKGMTAMSEIGGAVTNPFGLISDPLAQNIVKNTILHPTQTAQNMGGGILNMLGVKTENGPDGFKVSPPKTKEEFIQNVTENAKNHPVATAMAVLSPFLLGSGGAAGGAEGMATGAGEAGAEDAAVAALPKVTGNTALDFIKPGRQISRGGDFRSAVISQADKAGSTVSGDEIASNIRGWAEKAKLSNLPDADAIENAAKSAEKLYAGKTFKPSQLQEIYNGIEKGYTKGGEPRSATASYIDRGIKDVLSDHLNQATGGQWEKGTSEMAKGYAAQKSPVKPFVKRAGAVGLGIAGLDSVRHLLGI